MSGDLFRLLVESVHDYAIFLLDPGGHVATWNVGAERIKGYRADEIVGKHFSVFYLEEDVRSGKCEHELEVAAEVGRFEDEGWRVRRDGTRFWANVVISAVRAEGGTLIGFSKVTRDLTERKRAEENQTARLVAERANRAKDEFLALLGHELRNPLAPIVTALELIRLRGEGDSREHAIIERQVKHMMRLVDDMLDISRITRGTLALDRQLVDIRDTVARAVELASPLMDRQGHHLAVHQPSDPVLIEGDDVRLTQVIGNLLTNAARYTDPGGHVDVTVVRDGGEVAVSVRDDGIGIDPELLPHVFGFFVRGRHSSERSPGGLGLGLGLVRTLVTRHGGRVEAHSEGEGRGATFTVRLPVAGATVSPATAEARARASTLRPQRILVVDDNDDALMLLGEALSQLGHDVRTASNPEAALDTVRSFAPDVAILDIGLPTMDGYELASRLRGELGDHPPRLIALTGYGQPHDRVRSEAAGFDAHLVKPVDVQLLLRSIAGA